MEVCHEISICSFYFSLIFAFTSYPNLQTIWQKDTFIRGHHTYHFDGNNLASGVYYYQLVTGDYREVRQMILLR
jgi:hypothetical protein